MPHSLTLISTISVSLALALVLGLLANRLRIPALVGYLLAGIIIGPSTPGFTADIELSMQLAEIGIILLMFGVGLHFSFRDLLAVRNIAIPGAIVQMSVATMLGFVAARLWGWSFGAGIVFGLSLSVASTVVLLKALEQRGALRTINGRIAIGWLIVEDLVMVLALVLLPVAAVFLGATENQTGSEDSLAKTLLITLSQVFLFGFLMLQIGKRLFPWLLSYAANTGSRELFTLMVVAGAMGIAYGAAELFGVSFALGAFFAGMVMRESNLSYRAAQESLPMRDAFAVLFFVSVGMLFNPMILVTEPLYVMITVMIIMLGKSMAAFALVLAFRYPINTAFVVSVSLAQIGEFSFILAGLGFSMGILPEKGLNLILAGSLLSIAMNPLLFRLINPARRWASKHSYLARALERSSDPLSELPATVQSDYVTGHMILAGFGNVGQQIGRSLKLHQIPMVIIDQNREVIEKLRKKDVHAVAGDATEPAVLIQAHVVRARVLVITPANPVDTRLIIDIARQLNPDINLLVHASSETEARELRNQYAARTFVSEQELAINMTQSVLASYHDD